MAQDKDSKNLNVPPLRFPGFTDGWKLSKLGDECEIQMCKRILAQQTTPKGGVPFFKIGTIGGQPDAYISYELFNLFKEKYNYPQKGEILISCAGTVGRCVRFDGNPAYFQDSNIVWPRNTQCAYTNDFLFYILSNQNWKHLNTTTIVRIYNDDLRSLKIHYPSIEEQKKITRLLVLIDERIATQNKIIDNLQSLIKGLAKTHYDNCHRLYFVKIRNLGKSYTVMNLSKEQLSDCGRPCILYGELFTQYGPIIDEIVSKTNVTGNLTLSSGRDLLFPSSTTVDALSLIAPSALTKSNIILAGDMFGIKVSDEYSPEYLSYYFNYIGMRDLAKYAIGSTIIHLHYKDIAEYTIKIPSINEQKAFVKLASFVKRKIDVEKNLLHNLTELKTYLLQKLFI